MKPPIFAYDGDLTILSSVDRAQSYLEPEDVARANLRIYDSDGRMLTLVHDRKQGWFGGSGRKVRLVEVEQEPGHANELRDRLRRFLEYAKCSDEQLQTASLARLVELSLPHESA